MTDREQVADLSKTKQAGEKRLYSRAYYSLHGVRRVRTKIVIDRPFRECEDSALLRNQHQRAIEEGLVCPTCQQPRCEQSPNHRPASPLS